MNRIDPPTDPGQLPPRTDDFTFCNVSSHPMTPIDFQAYEGATSLIVVMQPPPPGQNAVVDAGSPIYANRVVCHANVGGAPFDYEYDETPPGWFVSKFICGVQDGHQGGFVPFGLVILRERNGGGIQIVALSLTDVILESAAQ